jgi:AcrR family transcriptional regulator
MILKNVEPKIKTEKIIKQRYEQIIRVASELFSKKGYHSTSMREISNASGINLSYLYNYISGKDDILYLFYQSLYTKWSNLYEALLDSEEDPVEQMKMFIKSMIEIGDSFQKEIRTMITESRHLKKESLYEVLKSEENMIKSLEQLIIRGVEKGVFETDDTFLTANLIQWMLTIEPLRGWNFENYGSNIRDILITNMTTFILNGVCVRKEPS